MDSVAVFIARKFVFVHPPKTGGTFIRMILQKLHRQQVPPCSPRRLLHKMVDSWGKRKHRSIPLRERKHIPAGKQFSVPRCFFAANFPGAYDSSRWVHSGVSNLPGFFIRDSRKLILFPVRSIHAHYVSMWAFNLALGHKKYRHNIAFLSLHPDLLALYNKRFGNQSRADYSFRDYVEFMDGIRFRAAHRMYFPGIPRRHDIGFVSMRLIYALFPDPRSIMELSEAEFADFFRNGGYKEWFRRVRFIHTERLNEELCRFLLEMGYPRKRVQFVLSEKPVNIGRGRAKQDPYDAELWDYVYRKNWIFFEMFPEYRPADK